MKQIKKEANPILDRNLESLWLPFRTFHRTIIEYNVDQFLNYSDILNSFFKKNF